MSLLIDAKVLADAVGAVSSAVAARTTKPVLSMVKLQAECTTLKISATDTEVIVQRVAELGQEANINVLIDPVKSLSWLKEVSGTVELSEEGELVVMKSGRKKMQQPRFEANEFPDDVIGDESLFTMPYAKLAQMLTETEFAADKKEGARWALSGVMFLLEDGKLDVVATDTKRLAISSTAIEGDVSAKALVPLKAVSLVVKNGGSGDVKVMLSRTSAVFITDVWRLQTRLVEGKFPPYQSIIPKKLAHKAEVGVGEFSQAVRSAAVTTDKESKRVEFHFSGEECTLSSRTTDGLSEAVASVPGFDADVNIALDAHYVLEGMKVMDKNGLVNIRMTDANKPVLFTTRPDYTYLVMPLGERGE